MDADGQRLFGRTIRDMDKMESPKGKWMKKFIKNYQIRVMKHQKIQNAEAFIRTQLNRGKSFGVFIYQLKRWSGYCGLACIILMGIGLYGTYIYDYSQMARYQYLLAGVLFFTDTPSSPSVSLFCGQKGRYAAGRTD